MKTENLKGKAFKKVMNESPLYFLIEEKAKTSNILFYFVPNERRLKIYDIAT